MRNKLLSLAAAALALLFAAPVAAQVPPNYDLQIKGAAFQINMTGGQPMVPVGLIVGTREDYVQLPGGAVLRLYPEQVFVLGRFDELGRFYFGFEHGRLPNVGITEFFVQGLSATNPPAGLDFKFCTSELMHVETDFARHWKFEYRN